MCEINNTNDDSTFQPKTNNVLPGSTPSLPQKGRIRYTKITEATAHPHTVLLGGAKAPSLTATTREQP